MPRFLILFVVLQDSLCFSGTYSLTVEPSGFKKPLRIDIDVDVGKTCGLNLMMETGNITELVPVAA